MHYHRADIDYRASELGRVVTQFTEYDKVGYLLNGISEGSLEAIKCAILSDQAGLRLNFASATRYVMEFIESTSAASSDNTRNIYEVRGDCTGSRNRNDQGRYKSNTHGGRGGGVWGRGGK